MGEFVQRRFPSQIRSRITEWLIDHPSWKAAIPWAALWVGLTRIGAGAVMAAAWLVNRPILYPILQNHPGLYGYTPLYTTLAGESFLGVWLHWDAVHYINLAIGGYFGNITGDSVFYPLYFLLIRWFGRPFHTDLVLVSLTLSTLATFFALVFLYRIADHFYGTQTARWSVIALAIYPTSLFLIGPYTESLFIALTLAAFWFAYQGSWLWVGLFGALGSLSRGPGMYTTAALIWPAVHQLGLMRSDWDKIPRRRRALVLIGLGMPIAAGVAFLAWKHWAGFPSLIEVYRNNTHWIVADPITALSLAILACVRAPDFITILEAASAVVFLGFTVLLIVKPRWRRIE